MTDPYTTRIQQMLDFAKHADKAGFKDYMSSFIHHIDLVSVDADSPTHHVRPRVVLGYTVRPEHCNSMGNMHGGAVATFFDFATSLAQAAPRPIAKLGSDDNEDPIAASWQNLGVSRTLAVTYVRPTPCDTDVLFDCEVVHTGRTMSSLRGVMRRRSDGAVLATCEHGKVQTYLPRSSL
ncbi:thioesterase family protein [Grosmannia clavigera kw1407]|uniref:Thioesterase family protein n=1 Tax=Grosmannia clavigera (strain kw1407 / UAMH 11150) TaxID=655863 RepID=F0XFK1_GROCL|nr:thioesterase family protein [Grosmannia clavigera kw1407]EFX03911.1 thioesterase family protein [Grosmannia clavigera kw1407]